MVRPWIGLIVGSGEGDPTDRTLHGVAPASWQDVTQITGVSWFAHIDTRTNFAGWDSTCPAQSQGVRTAATAVTCPLAIGTAGLGGQRGASGTIPSRIPFISG